MGIETGTAITIAALLGAGTAVGTSMYSSHQQSQESKRAREAANRAAGQQSIGNLTDGEAKASASRKAFRQGLYFTSPTGLKTGARGRSRLMGM